MKRQLSLQPASQQKRRRKRKVCREEGCGKIPSFGPLGGASGSAQFCLNHVPKGDEESWENVLLKCCQGQDEGNRCKSTPAYGPLGGARSSAKYCKKHIPEEERDAWENVVSKRCEGHELQGGSCKKIANFGPLDGTRTSARFCKTHIPEGEENAWEDVRSSRCEGQDGGFRCKVRPHYGKIDGPAVARYCRKHIPKGEEDTWEHLSCKRCEGTDNGQKCGSIPIFGPLNGTKASACFCKKHIPEGEENAWEDVVSKRCEKQQDGVICKVRAHYGPVGGSSSSAKYCRKHIPECESDLWEVVTYQRCKGIDDGQQCNASPVFAPPGESARFCRKHIPNGDETAWEDVKHKRCEGQEESGEQCSRQPNFGLLGGTTTSARFCKRHIPPGEESAWEDVKSPRCLQEGCRTSVGSKFRGYCLPCFASLFPLEEVSRNYKTKERLVVQSMADLVKREFSDVFVTYDKAVAGGISRKRPDIAIKLESHVVIIECDEEAHNTEEYCSCENKRMMQLFEDYRRRPIVFLRFNPDSYTTAVGTKASSCFGRTKGGLLKVTKEAMWNERLRVLQERVRRHVEEIPGKEVTIEHLYYDGFH